MGVVPALQLKGGLGRSYWWVLQGAVDQRSVASSLHTASAAVSHGRGWEMCSYDTPPVGEVLAGTLPVGEQRM